MTKKTLSITTMALFFLLLLSFHSHAVAIPIVEQRQSIKSGIDFLEESSGVFSHQDILEGKAGPFKPLAKENWGFGYKKIMWIRFALDFRNYHAPYWFLMQGFLHVGELDLFYPTANGYRRMGLHESEPFGQRAFQIRNYLFQVPSPPTPTATYYMRFDPQGHALTIELSVAGQKGMIEYLHFSQLNLGLFIGGMLAIWLYNFILFMELRTREYFYYLYYLGCCIVTVLYLNGFAPLIIDSPAIYEIVFAVFSYCTIHGMVLFARQFLSLRETVPRLDKLLKIIQWTLLGGAILALFLPVGLPYPILNTIIFVVGPTLVSAGLIRWWQGYKPAIFYSAGWIIFSISLVIYSLRLTGFLPVSFFTDYAVQVASVWEAILFSFALAYRIKVIEKSVAMAKNTFLGMVSHELKTPLQRITTSADLLLAMPHAEQERKSLLRIQSAAEHLDMQVKDLTDFALLESGKMRFHPVDFDPGEMVADIAEEFQASAAAKGIGLRRQGDATQALVRADARRIQQILINLVTNAIKYTHRGHVTITLHHLPERQAMRLIVEDSGIGISEEDQACIFEPFTQVADSRVTKYDGIGMGLTIVRSLTDLLGGEMELTSALGHGSRFSVTLPVIYLRQPASQPVTNASRKVLVVDDDPDVCASLRDVLTMLSYECDQACGGVEALDMISRHEYGAILLDINMPDVDGLEVAARMRRSTGANRNTPVVWISATASYDLDPAQKALFVHCLEKPFRADALKTMLAGILDGGAVGVSQHRGTGLDDIHTPLAGAPSGIAGRVAAAIRRWSRALR